MRYLFLILSAGLCLTSATAATSCIVSGYEGNLTRPLAGTCAEKTYNLSGRIEGQTWCADESTSGLFDSLVKVLRESEAGPLCSLRLGFLLLFK